MDNKPFPDRLVNNFAVGPERTGESLTSVQAIGRLLKGDLLRLLPRPIIIRIWPDVYSSFPQES